MRAAHPHRYAQRIRRRHHPHVHRETTRGWQVLRKCFASVRKCLASKSACLDLPKSCLDLRRSCQSLAKVLRRWVLGWGRPCVFGNRYVPSTQIFSDFLIRFSQISARSAPPLIRAAYYANSYAQRASCKHKKKSADIYPLTSVAL